MKERNSFIKDSLPQIQSLQLRGRRRRFWKKKVRLAELVGWLGVWGGGGIAKG